jgi:hypothetical protein
MNLYVKKINLKNVRELASKTLRGRPLFTRNARAAASTRAFMMKKGRAGNPNSLDNIGP